jgi:hypothetical protein
VTQKCRDVLDQVRGAIRQGNAPLLSDETIIDQAEAQIKMESRPGHIRVVNASFSSLLSAMTVSFC